MACPGREGLCNLFQKSCEALLMIGFMYCDASDTDQGEHSKQRATARHSAGDTFHQLSCHPVTYLAAIQEKSN
jgi:hypothetical protein